MHNKEIVDTVELVAEETGSEVSAGNYVRNGPPPEERTSHRNATHGDLYGTCLSARRRPRSSDRALVGNIQDLPARLAVYGVEVVTLQTAGRAREAHLVGLQ